MQLLKSAKYILINYQVTMQTLTQTRQVRRLQNGDVKLAKM